jgi:hypothetical protein
MEEWYKLWDYQGKQSKLWIPGDTIYVSNYGNVRLNDIQLTIGDGLWMDEHGDVHIVGVSFGKYKSIYRFVYTMAVDNTFNGGHQWQIHHIDRNHSNNRYDNLIKVTGKQHLHIHSTDQCDNELIDKLNTLKEYYKEQSNKRHQHIATFKQWLTNRYNKYYNDVIVPQLEQQRKERQKQLEKKKHENKLLSEKRKEERKQQKLIEQQKLIDAGTHFRCKDGRLMSYDHLQKLNAAGLNRDKSYITDEYKNKLSVANKGKSHKQSDETINKIRNKINQLYAEGAKIGGRSRCS